MSTRETRPTTSTRGRTAAAASPEPAKTADDGAKAEDPAPAEPPAAAAAAETAAKKPSKPRVMREKVIGVVDPANGTTTFYRAFTQTQARAKHIEGLSMREATLDEIIAIGAGKLACTNALNTAEPADPAQQTIPGVPVENLGGTPVDGNGNAITGQAEDGADAQQAHDPSS